MPPPPYLTSVSARQAEALRQGRTRCPTGDESRRLSLTRLRLRSMASGAVGRCGSIQVPSPYLLPERAAAAIRYRRRS